MIVRRYKGHTVEIRDGTYTLDGKTTVRGNRGSPTARGAWKAAKSEINRNRRAIP